MSGVSLSLRPPTLSPYMNMYAHKNNQKHILRFPRGAQNSTSNPSSSFINAPCICGRLPISEMHVCGFARTLSETAGRLAALRFSSMTRIAHTAEKLCQNWKRSQRRFERIRWTDSIMGAEGTVGPIPSKNNCYFCLLMLKIVFARKHFLTFCLGCAWACGLNKQQGRYENTLQPEGFSVLALLASATRIITGICGGELCGDLRCLSREYSSSGCSRLDPRFCFRLWMPTLVSSCAPVAWQGSAMKRTNLAWLWQGKRSLCAKQMI